MISVSQGQFVAMASPSAAVEMKNKIQYKPFELFLTSMCRILRKNKAGSQNSQPLEKIGFLEKGILESFYYFRRPTCIGHTLVKQR
jgi:hypothetical protein